MNKKESLYLNSIEFISYVLSLVLMGLYLNNNIIGLKQTLFLLGATCGLVFIGIELFLLLVMNNKARLAYISYLLISIVLGVLINTKIPFGAFIVFIVFSLTKNVLRFLLTDKLYITKEYKKYAKIFDVEVKDLKKNVSKTFNRNKVVIPAKDIVVGKKTRKNYAKKDLA